MKSSRQILAENVRAMIRHEELTVRGFAMRHDLQQKMLDRIVKEENAVSIDTMDDVAKKLGLFPWQMLVQGLDATNPPHIAVNETELRLYERLKGLVKS